MNNFLKNYPENIWGNTKEVSESLEKLLKESQKHKLEKFLKVCMLALLVASMKALLKKSQRDYFNKYVFWCNPWTKFRMKFEISLWHDAWKNLSHPWMNIREKTIQNPYKYYWRNLLWSPRKNNCRMTCRTKFWRNSERFRKINRIAGRIHRILH